MADTARDVFAKYKKIVSENPDNVSQIETTFRLLSYVIAGKFQDSQVISELLYASSNILVFLNDLILQQSAKVLSISPLIQEKLKQLLTVIEYLEVFIELSSQRYISEGGKWILIVAVQVTKTLLRLLLLWKHDSGILPSPPILSVNRKKLLSARKRDSTTDNNDNFQISDLQKTDGEKKTFTLKRSGKKIRSLDAAPPMHSRNWNLSDEGETKESITQPTELSDIRKWAETLHASRPVIHLLSLYYYGMKSWKPWILSCGIDVASMHMMGDPETLNPLERRELKRRTMMLLFYLLRSPFYDIHSRVRIVILLHMLSNNIPLASIIIKPILDYLPVWQKIYSYVWAV